jgi:hypothetical protein
MPSDPRKRQKKLERRRAKNKAKHQQLVKAKHAGLAERLAANASAPFFHSWATESIWTDGIGQVCLSRLLPGGQVAFAIFLVDRYCLGVKDAWANIQSRSDFESHIQRGVRGRLAVRDLMPADVRKLIEGAVAYAESLGLHPHSGYQKAKLLFGDIDSADSTMQFEFGKDGKPFFIGGPHDTPERCALIVRTLEENCGKGRYEYLLSIAGDNAAFPMAEGAGFEELALENEDGFDETNEPDDG